MVTLAQRGPWLLACTNSLIRRIFQGPEDVSWEAAKGQSEHRLS